MDLRARSSLSSALVAALFAAACGGNTDEVQGTCSPACGAGETCVSGMCESLAPDAGPACTTDAQCAPGVCDQSTNTCVASDCQPACPVYESCTGRTCAPLAGRCATSADCPASLPVCDPTNTCAAPTLSTPTAQSYTALIVTNQAYAAAFQQIAQWHTLTGVPTRVETVEDICAAAPNGCSTTDACNDAPKAIKDYLIAQHALGIAQVVLGGDASIVPSRSTHAYYDNPIYPPAFDEEFYSDDYYGDLTNWDSNGDCVYGDASSDSFGYIPTLGISRISVSSPAELSAYFAKEQSYLTGYDLTRLNTALFLSNIAAEITVPVINETVPVDSALYFETPGRTLSYVPDTFDITKLYSELGTIWPGAQPLTVPLEETTIEQGFNLIVHSGHGDESDVTVEQDGSNEFSGQMAYGLDNTQYPVMISCACDAATFADGDGCAGQNFITAPMGGGIGYMGNSATGLGIAGGMQLLDQFVKYVFAQKNPLIGDAIVAAHVNMPESDTFGIPVDGVTVGVPVVDLSSWQWTQKAVTYLGDGLLPIYTDVTTAAAPAFTVQRVPVGDFSQIRFVPSIGVMGTLAVTLGADSADIYDIPLDGTGDPVTLTVAGAPTQVTYGFSSVGTLAAYQQLTLP